MTTSKLPTQDQVNIFLDGLRESAITNMFGAGSYIEGHFGIDKNEAKDMLLEWMNTFSERHPQ